MKKTLIEKKDILINDLIEDLKANEPESREYIYDLVREALRNRTLSDLKEMVKESKGDFFD